MWWKRTRRSFWL